MRPEASVLGIDAAWTESGSSGVAVVHRVRGRWQLTGVWDSYESLPGSTGAPADRTRLISTITALQRPDLVAVDMPLSHQPIRSRREADDAVSRLYGSRHASTHTPNETRPGVVGKTLMDKLAAAGFPLATRIVTPPCLIEVYPHPALIELMAAAVRLPYKVGKSRKYWPAASPVERRSRLLAIWSSITTALEQHIGGVLEALPLPEPTASGLILKAFEDKIDAIVCAWVGIEALEGRAMPFGDEDASIWIPVR